jgi:chromosome segregation ATPase
MLKRKFTSISSSLIDSTIQIFQESIKNQLSPESYAADALSSHLEEVKTSIQELHETESELQQKLALETRKCHALQDFLVNELRNSEKLESDLMKLKEEFTSTKKERDYFKKMYNSHIEELTMLATKQSRQILKQTVQDPAAASSSSANPTAILSQTLLQKYIRKLFNKKFFYGVVIGYMAPYYKVSGVANEVCRL